MMTSIDTIFWLFAGFAFVFGAVVGSFLNVVIFRVPAGLSVVHPPSHCPRCDAGIRWYDNIPIISWAIFLRAKCRDCGAPISGQYALVEALTGALTLALWYKDARAPFASMQVFEQTPAISYLLPFGLYFVFICLLVVITFVDLEHLLIPHRFSLPGIALGIATPFLFNALMPAGSLVGFWPPVTPMESIIGAIAGGVTVIAIFYGYFALRGVPGMGGGDVTLMAMVGAWLGWPSLVFIFFAASLQALVGAGVAHLFGLDFLKDGAEVFADDEPLGFRDQKEEASVDDAAEGEGEEDESAEEVDDTIPAGKLALPFGPFIALAALEFLILGPYLPDALSMRYFY